MSRYKYTKLLKLGPVDGFMIHTPDNRKLKDTHPQTIVRELNRMADRIKRMEEVLTWCESKVSDCNRKGPEGDAARYALAKDLGRKAKEAKL